MEEYLKDAKTPEDIRNAFTEMMGDSFIVIPSIMVASQHRGWLQCYWQNFIPSEVSLLVGFTISEHPML